MKYMERRGRQETNGVRQIRSKNRLGIIKKCKVKNATGTMGQGWLGRPLKQGYKKGDPRQTDMCSWSWSFGNDRTNGQLDCKREGDGRLGKGP